MKNKTKLYNGKPISHWEDQARELVVSILLRGYFQYKNSGQIKCLPQDIASKQLFNMALAVGESYVKKLVTERISCQKGMAVILSDIETNGLGSVSKETFKHLIPRNHEHVRLSRRRHR